MNFVRETLNPTLVKAILIFKQVNGTVEHAFKNTRLAGKVLLGVLSNKVGEKGEIANVDIHVNKHKMAETEYRFEIVVVWLKKHPPN